MPNIPLDHIISFSGGKDSTALYLLALERGRSFRAVFADTGNEHEEVYDFVRSLPEKVGGPSIEWVRADFSDKIERKRKTVESKWREDGVSEEIIEEALSVLQPTGNPFLDLCIWKGRFPSSRVRFCTEELKVLPIRREIYEPAFEKGRAVVSWQGVRAQESFARSLLPKWQRLEDVGRLYAYRPLLSWTIEDIWNMHKRHGITPNPLYSQGMTRVGCMPCIMCKKDELREIAMRFPEEVQKIERWEQIVSAASKRGSSTFFSVTQDENFGEGEINFRTHGIRHRVEWAKTSRGGRQYDLIASSDFLTSCDQWGACE